MGYIVAHESANAMSRRFADRQDAQDRHAAVRAKSLVSKGCSRRRDVKMFLQDGQDEQDGGRKRQVEDKMDAE